MMEQSLSGEIMKTQDLPDVVVAVSRNPHGYKLAWDFLRANWHTMIKKSVSTVMQILHIHTLIFKSAFLPCHLKERLKIGSFKLQTVSVT